MGHMPLLLLLRELVLHNLGAFESVALAVLMLIVLIALLTSISPGSWLFPNNVAFLLLL